MKALVAMIAIVLWSGIFSAIGCHYGGVYDRQDVAMACLEKQEFKQYVSTYLCRWDGDNRVESRRHVE
jgi:hypothetical protein